MWTGRMPTAGHAPSTPPRHPQISRGNSLEERVRGMIISNSPSYRQNSQDLSPGHPTPLVPLTPHTQDQFYKEQDYSIPFPPENPGFDSQLLPINPSPQVSGPQALGSQFGAPLPPVHSTHLSPSHGPPFALGEQPQQTVPLLPQNQPPNLSSISALQDQRHMGPTMQQYPAPQRLHQQPSVPNRQVKPRGYPWTGGRRPQFRHGPQRNSLNSGVCSHPPLPADGLDQFPPLGTEHLKNVLPKPPSPSKSPQTNAQEQTQHRTQYQSFPLQSRPPSQRKPAFRNPQLSPQAGKSRTPPLNLEQMIYEQNTNLQVFAREIIATATPTPEELAAQNQHLKKCRAICRRICPEGELVPFGSLVTGFAITKSDLDAVLTSPYPEDLFSTPNKIDESNSLPQNLAKEFQSEGFEATLLLKTRVPILKLALKATDESSFDLNCDIGFNNDLGVHNTRMLQTYSRCDPRVREMVLFIKWWAKRRHINSPYRGTLSSYGYVLMIIHFLINVVDPPVLINLQNTPIPEDVPPDQIFDEGGEGEHQIWYAKDIENLPKTANQMHVGQLLHSFFEYYSYKFQWGREVISIRTQGGIFSKQEKGWVAAVIRPGRSGHTQIKDRYLFTIEDPFETSHNVGRTCNPPGVDRIRAEFKRAVSIIRFRDGGKSMRELLCQEAPPEKPWVRKEDDERMGGKSDPDQDANREMSTDTN
ncbi:unnamed protein product [Tuber melanosporum]|uniref:polynucleotide adenylyltransferase n=1 Tax=Tuber melanosporum (strain Mel28) TaxID=656061 RepID=D5GH86_TUBMM|nr:uncharacterized protein GSTUM_00007793001 [Tuber melanosporum]CAZ83911.1 unnamed protein product [Tuber melanosporum]